MQEGGAPRRFRVYRGRELVLELEDRPGPLISKPAPPPRPGQRPVLHPFLSAVAHSPEHEEGLRAILDASPDLPAFLAGLRRGGFRVEEQGT